ncbi:MAG: hypothetical protein KIS66_04955 [Fimbriimonadaceae bacterium]|nr:hypothetical protein [Fimbriimonadaceae bacterium]
MRSRFGPWLALLVLLLAGCGGGGGGGTDTNALVYTATWAAGGGVDGDSLRLSLYDGNGKLAVPSVLINKSGASVVQNVALPRGTYRAVAELYQGANLGGNRVGILETPVTVNGTLRLDTLIGAQPTQLRVMPGTASVQAQFSTRFYAVAYADLAQTTFVAPGSIRWQVLGSGARVDATGLAVGESPGTVTVRATHEPTALQAGATLTVQPFTPRRTKWTVLVYMNAANDLYSYSPLNFNQIESVAQNAEVRFVVQWKQSTSLFTGSIFNGTRRYLVRPDTSSGIASQLVQEMGSVDMGAPGTLRDFVDWGTTNFPADRTALVIWNHGSGWRRSAPEGRAVSYDDETGHAIQTWDLGEALGAHRFDILAWDASLMQMAEVAYEVKDQARYVVGSEESPPAEGYPYHTIFDKFRDRPDDPTATLCRAFVDGMLGVPAYATRKITQSVVDSTALGGLATAVDLLAAVLIANKDTIGLAVQETRALSQSYSQTAVRYYRDLYDVCLHLESRDVPVTVKTAAANVRAAIGTTVVFEGHNTNSPRSNGIAIDFSPNDRFSSDATDYRRMRFAADTRWDEWLAVAP